MSAVTPPRADLRGGSQSEDSFEISRRIFTQSVILCLFAESRWATNELAAQKALDPLTSAWIRATPRGSSIRQMPFSMHGFFSRNLGYSWRRGEMGVQFSERSKYSGRGAGWYSHKIIGIGADML